MSLNNNPPTSDTEVLRNMLHTPAGGKRKAKAKVLVMDPSAISVSAISRDVQRQYLHEDAFKNMGSVDERVRICDGIYYLMTEHPHIPLPMNLLYWMVNGGTKLKPIGNEEVERFSRRVSTCRDLMIQRYERSFEIKHGMIMGLVTREDHVAPLRRASKAVIRSHRRQDAMLGIVGNPETLKLPEAEKDFVRSVHQSVKGMTQAVKGLITAAATTTPKKK